MTPVAVSVTTSLAASSRGALLLGWRVAKVASRRRLQHSTTQHDIGQTGQHADIGQTGQHVC